MIPLVRCEVTLLTISLIVHTQSVRIPFIHCDMTLLTVSLIAHSHSLCVILFIHCEMISLTVFLFLTQFVRDLINPLWDRLSDRFLDCVPT